MLNGSSTLVAPVFLKQFDYLNSMLNMMLASNLYAIINKHIIALVILMVGFMISETAVATAEEKQMDESFSQSNFTDRNNIGVTCLETNKTKPDNAQVFSISDEDFWMVFEPLLEQSINGSTVSSE
ncbi:MAG: hypothetical protein WA461_07470 [Nitrososphaeraceae archaeon]